MSAYRVSPFSTLFHALYNAGGTTESGSLRSIEVMRNGKINRQNSYILVFHFTEKLRAVEESVFLESVGNLYEVAKCLHLVVYSIMAGRRSERRCILCHGGHIA